MLLWHLLESKELPYPAELTFERDDFLLVWVFFLWSENVIFCPGGGFSTYPPTARAPAPCLARLLLPSHAESSHFQKHLGIIWLEVTFKVAYNLGRSWKGRPFQFGWPCLAIGRQYCLGWNCLPPPPACFKLSHPNLSHLFTLVLHISICSSAP